MSNRTQSQIDALQKEIGDYEQAFGLAIQSRIELLLFIYSHFGIIDPLCTEEKIKDDFASQDRLVSMTAGRLTELRALSKHKIHFYAEIERLLNERIEVLEINQTRLLETVRQYETALEQDVKNVARIVEEKQDLEAELQQSKRNFDELARMARTGLERANSKYCSLESSSRSTIDDLREKLKVAVTKFNKLADMVVKGFP
jgi:DNA repair exonuclease SbcCD ATPase subunit